MPLLREELAHHAAQLRIIIHEQQRQMPLPLRCFHWLPIDRDVQQHYLTVIAQGPFADSPFDYGSLPLPSGSLVSHAGRTPQPALTILNVKREEGYIARTMRIIGREGVR